MFLDASGKPTTTTKTLDSTVLNQPNKNINFEVPNDTNITFTYTSQGARNLNTPRQILVWIIPYADGEDTGIVEEPNYCEAIPDGGLGLRRVRRDPPPSRSLAKRGNPYCIFPEDNVCGFIDTTSTIVLQAGIYFLHWNEQYDSNIPSKYQMISSGRRLAWHSTSVPSPFPFLPFHLEGGALFTTSKLRNLQGSSKANTQSVSSCITVRVCGYRPNGNDLNRPIVSALITGMRFVLENPTPMFFAVVDVFHDLDWDIPGGQKVNVWLTQA